VPDTRKVAGTWDRSASSFLAAENCPNTEFVLSRTGTNSSWRLPRQSKKKVKVWNASLMATMGTMGVLNRGVKGCSNGLPNPNSTEVAIDQADNFP